MDNFVFSNLPNLVFLIQCLLRISVSGHGIACLSADEKMFLGLEWFLDVLCDTDTVTGCRVIGSDDLLDVARPSIPAQVFSLVWLGDTGHWRLVLSFFAFPTSDKWSDSIR
jgi:hypothetical protein